MDFIVRLPELNEYNTIPDVVDRLTKMAHYILTRDDANSKNVISLSFNNLFRLYSLTDSIISD